jgi:hypothetical protein
MGILNNILGGGKVIEEGFKLIDSMHTSEEEEIAAKSKAKTDLLIAYAPFKVAQRYLALLFTVTFLASFLLVLGMTLFGETQIDDVRAVIAEFWIGEIMLVIVGFYFSGGALEGVMKVRKK